MSSDNVKEINNGYFLTIIKPSRKGSAHFLSIFAHNTVAPFLEVLLRALGGDTEAGSPFPKSVFQHGTVLLYSSDCFAAMGKAQWLH